MTKGRSELGDVLVREGSGLTLVQGQSIYFDQVGLRIRNNIELGRCRRSSQLEWQVAVLVLGELARING